MVTTVTEYFWNFEVQYELSAFAGASAEVAHSLQRRTGKYAIVTQTEGPPRPQVVSGHWACDGMGWRVW